MKYKPNGGIKLNINIKELILYIIVVIILVTLSICNNLFWKIGKEEQKYNEITNLKSGNVIYNAPFEEKWLD